MCAAATKWLPRDSIHYQIMEIPCSDHLGIFPWTIYSVYFRMRKTVSVGSTV